MALTREQILAARKAKDLPKERVETPEWAPEETDPAQACVYCPVLSGKERDAWEQSLSTGEGKKAKVSLENIRARAMARCACDEQGNRLGFTVEDVQALGELESAPLHRFWDAFTRVNKMSQEHIEDLTKNSESDPGNSSSLTPAVA